MKIVFLESAAQDIQWFRYYDQSIFPEGSAKARDRLKAIQTTLAANPYIGQPSDTVKTVRAFSIPRTPFTLIYRVTASQIEVFRLWDTRQGDGY